MVDSDKKDKEDRRNINNDNGSEAVDDTGAHLTSAVDFARGIHNDSARRNSYEHVPSCFVTHHSGDSITSVTNWTPKNRSTTSFNVLSIRERQFRQEFLRRIIEDALDTINDGDFFEV